MAWESDLNLPDPARRGREIVILEYLIRWSVLVTRLEEQCGRTHTLIFAAGFQLISEHIFVSGTPKLGKGEGMKRQRIKERPFQDPGCQTS